MPFQVTVQVYNIDVPSTIIDEGAYISLLSSTTWKYLGSLQLVPITQSLLDFNKGTSQPLGILMKFPITLGGKIVYLSVLVFQGPLDFNLLLGHDYVYVTGVLFSSLFHVISFLHEGRIVVIRQISFIGPNLTLDQPSSLNGPCMQVV